MTSIGLIYFAVKAIEISVFIFVGNKIKQSPNKSKYWDYAILAIITYALAEGLRWGHDIDYNVYCIRYNQINHWLSASESSNPGFSIIVYFFKLLNTPYWLFIIFQCAFVSFSYLYFFQDYKKYAPFIIPAIVCVDLNENFIRYCLAFGFVLIALRLYLHKKIIPSFFLLAISLTIHFAMGFFLPFILFSKKINSIKLPTSVLSLLYITSIFFVSISSLHFLIYLTSFLGSFGTYEEHLAFSYLNSMDTIIKGEAGRLGLMTAGLTNDIKKILIGLPIILLSRKYLERVRYGVYIYNLTVLGLILSPIFSQVELLGRFSSILYFFSTICLGVLAQNILLNYRQPSYLKFILIISLISYYYAFINAPFVREDILMYFLWDSNGLEYIPIYKLLK